MIDLTDLEKNGYCILQIESSQSLLALGRSLGELVPSRRNSTNLIDILTVTTNRSDKSLSAKYTHYSFPFHTDGAYLLHPPRYIILRSEAQIIGCPTYLCSLPLDDDNAKVLKRDVWLVNGGRGKFYTAILSESQASVLLRYDTDCMRPAISVNNSVNLIATLINEATPIQIDWKKHQTLIIDNWKLLHARADATQHLNRTLQRIWIKKMN